MGEANILGELESAWIHGGESALAAAKISRYGTTLLPIHVARAFGARGMVQTLPAACAAGNYAIGFAADQIRAGRADVAIAGASGDHREAPVRGLRSARSDRARQVPAVRQESAGTVARRRRRDASSSSPKSTSSARGGTPLAEVGGYGLACDAHHITRPHPDGAGSATAMRRAIESSGISLGRRRLHQRPRDRERPRTI